MITLLSALLAVSVLLNVATVLVVPRYIRRLFQFDLLLETIADDIDVNLKVFDEINKSSILVNTPEIMSAHQNMMVMRDRLHEFSLRIQEATNRRKALKASTNRPVVV